MRKVATHPTEILRRAQLSLLKLKESTRVETRGCELETSRIRNSESDGTIFPGDCGIRLGSDGNIES